MKHLFLIILILFSFSATAQLYAGFQITGVSAEVSAGYLSKPNIQIEIGARGFPKNSQKPWLVFIATGYMIPLTNYEQENNFSLTPSIGYGKRTKTTVFDDIKGGVETVVSYNPFLSLQAGKDAKGIGRAIVTVAYCKTFYYGVGIKAFFR